MNSVPLVLPFTLAASDSGLEGPSDVSPCARILVEEASSAVDVSCISYWLKPGLASPSAQQFSSSDALEAVVLGCEDGTLYLLRQSHHHTPALISIEKPLLPRPPSPIPLSNRSRSRPRTPTSSLAPFSLTSRARVVSGISDEQAQAPKNFVDFDEEPEKLKELLRGRARHSFSTDRPSLSFNRTASTERQPVLSKGLSSPSGSVRRSGIKSLLSATHSPALSIASLPSPTSPSSLPSPLRPSYHLSLDCHIFPPRSGPGNAAVGLHTLVNGRHFICLQSQGDLSIYAVKDGSCVLSLQIPQHPAVPPTDATEVKPSEAVWVWKGLFVHETRKSVVILTSATIDEGFNSQLSVDSEEDSRHQQSRVAIFELRDNIDRGDEELSLDKVAEWLVEGPGAGIGFCTDGNDALRFFHVDTSNHLIVQRIVLLPAVIQLQSESPGDSGSMALAALNPFKATANSQDHAASPDDRRESCRVVLEDLLDIGELKPNQKLQGIKVCFTRERIRGVAWSDSELYGFEYGSQRLTINQLATTHEKLKDIIWLGWDTYCATYSERIQVSRLRLVDPNNDRVSDKRSPGILHSHVVNTVAIHAAQALRPLSSTAVLHTGVSSGGRRQIGLYTAASTENRGEWAQRTLWKSYDRAKTVSDDDRRITCMLPLELTHVILGYSDGTISRSSFATLVQLKSNLAPGDVSDIPLNGFIVGLHIAQNDRTGERLIVGGADDGSVAIWSLETMKTLARWILFISPLRRVLHLRYDKGGPLMGCL
ncbi:hypothetical protein BJV78DRAFT_1364863, partial [Lactifluus subvellereus]